MNYNHLVKHLSANALLWTGIAAIALTLLEGSFYFLLFFAGLVALNFCLIMILNQIAPGLLKHEFRGANGANSSNGNIAFKFSPLKYPKVLDEETREYVPELIRIDINSGSQTIFSGNMARNALKQFQKTISDALTMKDNAPITAPNAPIIEKKKAQKKAKT